MTKRDNPCRDHQTWGNSPNVNSSKALREAAAMAAAHLATTRTLMSSTHNGRTAGTTG